jgi:hypothetical protein
MTEAEREAQEQVGDVAQALAKLQERLEEIVRALPKSPGELDLSDLVDDPDVVAEVRRVVECVLMDNLRPAVDDLLAASSYRTGGKRDEED